MIIDGCNKFDTVVITIKTNSILHNSISFILVVNSIVFVRQHNLKTSLILILRFEIEIDIDLGVIDI